LEIFFYVLESKYMSLNSPESPKQIETTRLKPEEWLDPKNTRTIIHINRNTLLDVTRKELAKREPTLAMMGGFCLFRTYTEDSELSVMLTNNNRISGARSTVVSINKLRSPEADEPGFPNGRVLDLLDVAVPITSRWLNTGRQTLYRGQHEHAWSVPKNATLHQPRNGHLALIGNLQDGDFKPLPARNMAEVEEDADALWQVYSALSYCDEVSLCEDITSITIPKQA
jgi:hypothetical protein